MRAISLAVRADYNEINAFYGHPQHNHLLTHHTATRAMHVTKPTAYRTAASVCEALDKEQHNRLPAKTAIAKFKRSTARESVQGRAGRGGHVRWPFAANAHIDRPRLSTPKRKKQPLSCLVVTTKWTAPQIHRYAGTSTDRPQSACI